MISSKGTEPPKLEFVFSEETDNLVSAPILSGNSDSFKSSQEDQEAEFFRRLKEFKKREPGYMAECGDILVKVISECETAHESKACFEFHQPKLSVLDAKYNKLLQRREAQKEETRKILELVAKDDKEGLFKLKNFDAPENEVYKTDIIETAIKNNSIKVLSTFINKDKRTYVQTAFNVLFQRTSDPLSMNELSSLKYLKPFFSKQMVNDTITLDAAETIVKADNSSVLEQLIKLGLNINRKNEFDQDLVVLAVQEKKPQALAAFLNSGTKVDHADQLGQSLLHIALNERDLEMTEYLMKKGANPRRPRYGSFGDSAIQVAKESGHEELIRAVSKK